MEQATTGNERQLEQYRDYVYLLARLRVGGRLGTKADASDIAQQTLLQAHAGRSLFRGSTEAEWLAWLRAILDNALAATARRYATRGRDACRERPLDADANPFASDHTSPSDGASRAEDLLRLARALAGLPADQRAVIELHHLEGLPVAETAARLGRTPAAVVGLLYRGLRKLRELLGDRKEAGA